MTDRDRFEAKFQSLGEDDCWPWRATVGSNGYGQFRLRGQMRNAHYACYELYVAPIPRGMVVLHTCDNRLCVNLAHLRLGTQLENVQDMFAKGRDHDKRGSKNGNSKLTPDEVKEIKSMLEDAHPQAEIADRFGISKATVSQINTGRIWGDL